MELFHLVVLVAAGLCALVAGFLFAFAVNIPLNNEIQSIEVAATGAVEQKQARERFEARWNRSNRIRTAFAVVTMLLLLVVLMRLPAT
jgi:uncharacterized membrane protein